MQTNFSFLKYLLAGLLVPGLFSNTASAQGNHSKARIVIRNRVSVFAGANTNSSFILREGLLWSCGDNSFGQLGIGNDINTTSRARQVGIENAWTMLATGSFHTIAIKQDGSLWSWGDNQYGQIGDGSLVNKAIPVPVLPGEKWIMAAGADYQSFAINKDGSLWAWGVNNYGQLGIGTATAFINIPQQVGTGHDWKAVSAGSFHTLALKKDGTLWAWGYGADGQLGLGNTTSYKSPVQVGDRHDWEMISAAGFQSFAIRRDGTLWSWGDNEYGVLGNGTADKQLKPVMVNGDTTWKIVASGFHHTAAIKTDGSLWVWGNNFSGESGLGRSGGAFFAPVQVGTEKNWEYISLGFAHTLALKKDRTRWAWGQNDYGQLGTGDILNKNYPVQLEYESECGDELLPTR